MRIKPHLEVAKNRASDVVRMLFAASRQGLLPARPWRSMLEETLAAEDWQAHYEKMVPVIEELTGFIDNGDLGDAALNFVIALQTDDLRKLARAEEILGGFCYSYAASLADDHLENVFKAGASDAWGAMWKAIPRTVDDEEDTF
jgi:hypothetical protein